MPKRVKVDRRNMHNDYIALGGLDFSWKKKEVDKIITMVKRGATIITLSKVFKREGDEVFLLLLDLARRGKIKPDHDIFKEC